MVELKALSYWMIWNVNANKKFWECFESNKDFDKSLVSSARLVFVFSLCLFKFQLKTWIKRLIIKLIFWKSFKRMHHKF